MNYSNTIELGNSSVTAISTYGHIVTQSTIGAVSDDGTYVTSGSASGSDVAGTVTESSNAGGAGWVKITFANSYGVGAAPVVVVSPANASAVSEGTYYVSSTATDFTINFTANTGQTSAVFNYIVIH